MHALEIAGRWAWETSLAASVLVAPALLAAVFLRKQAFTPIRYLLGLLVAARLLLPVTIPSPFSIFNFVPSSTAAALPPAPISPTAIGPVSMRPAVVPMARPVPWLAILWALGAFVLLGRVAVHQLKVRRLIKGSDRIVEGTAVEILNEAGTLTGCRRPVALYSVFDFSTPALFGFFRPAILLPRAFVESADAAQLRMVFLHELAHVRRMDVLVNWLSIFAQALHWFNQLVWLAMRRLRADQELLCDSQVMKVLRPEEHHAYGETLLALATPRNFTLSPLIPVSSNFKQLKERIAMIKQFKPARRLLLFALPPLAAILAIATFTAATSKHPLRKPEERSSISRETDRDKHGKTVALLQNALENQTAELRAAEENADRLRNELNLPPVTTESELYASNLDTLKHLEADRIKAEQEYVQYKQLVDSIKSKPRNQQIMTLPTAYRDSTLDSLLEQLGKSQQQLAILQKDYSDEHQEVQRLAALLKEVNRQIDARLDGVLGGLESLVSSRRAVYEALNKELATLKAEERSRAERARPYFKALREIEMERKLSEAIHMQLVQEKVNSLLSN